MRKHQEGGIAIVGMAGRFPGAVDVEALWSMLRAGHEGIPRFSAETLISGGLPGKWLDDAAYVRAGGRLDGIERFDAARFGISPREAALMDPQQRLFLECCLHGLEDAGHDSRRFPGWVGVFAGSGAAGYLLERAAPVLASPAELQRRVMGSLADFLPTRVAYRLDLRGPAVNVQTACSTSLVATHLACQSLLSFECDMALAGGVSLSMRQGYLYEPGFHSAPDGHCRPLMRLRPARCPEAGAGWSCSDGSRMR